MVEILSKPGDETVVASVREEVQALCRRFPLPYRSLGVHA
jgi:glycine/serine hydroxymethyltransferase